MGSKLEMEKDNQTDKQNEIEILNHSAPKILKGDGTEKQKPK